MVSSPPARRQVSAPSRECSGTRSHAPRELDHLVFVDPFRGGRGKPALSPSTRVHALRQAAARHASMTSRRCDRRPLPLRERAERLDRGRRLGPDQGLRYSRRRADGRDDDQASAPWRAPSRPSGSPTSSGRPSSARAGCASCRPPAVARAFPRRGGCDDDPFVQWQAPLVWTTLSLTIHADGSAEGTIEGSSRFPRHWVYDEQGQLAQKSGLADFKDWYRKSFGRHTPWGDQDSKALVTAVETALERRLSEQVMRGGSKPQGAPGQGRQDTRRARRCRAPRSSSFSTASCASSTTASDSPSTARARCSASARTSTAAGAPRRLSRSRHAGSPRCEAEQLDRSALEELSKGHRREKAARGLSRRASPSSVGCAARPQRRALTTSATAGTRPVSPSRTTIDDGARADPRRGDRDPGASRRCSTVPPFSGAILLTHLHWDHVQGLPFFAAADRDDASVRLLIPEQEDGASAESMLARAMSPPHFPMTPADLRGEWSFRQPRARASTRIEGFEVLAREIPAQGRAHVRLPRQRRARDAHVHARPPAHGVRPRARRLW